VKVALRPSNVKRLYTDEKSAKKRKNKEQNKRKVKGRTIQFLIDIWQLIHKFIV